MQAADKKKPNPVDERLSSGVLTNPEREAEDAKGPTAIVKSRPTTSGKARYVLDCAGSRPNFSLNSSDIQL
jgi:hypothetical protein